MYIYNLIILIIVINYIIILYNKLQIFIYLYVQNYKIILFQYINIILICIFKKNYFLS